MTNLTATTQITQEQLRMGNGVMLKAASEGEVVRRKVIGVELNGVRIDNWPSKEAPGAPDGLVPFNDLMPISLSHEMFEAAGFRYSNVKLWYENSEGFVISHHKDGAFYCPFIENIESPVLKHLHELQNLYFALTGKELEINL
jgi:hypothetical protein